MSMIASLDALEAVTDVKAAPRAAVFQPKVKARVKKGGAGRNSVTSVPVKSRPIPPRENASASTVSIPGITADNDNATIDRGTIIGADGSQVASPGTQALADNVDGGSHEPPAIREGTVRSSIHDEPASLPSVDASIRDQRPTAVRSDIPSPRSQSSPTRTTGGEQLERGSNGSSKPGIVRENQSSDAGSLRADGIGLKTHPARKSSPRLSPAVETQDKLDNDDDPELRGNPAEEQPPTLATEPSETYSGAMDTAAAGEERDGLVADEAPVAEEQGANTGDLDEAGPESVSTGRRRSKRAFPHSTSRSRNSRPERADIAPKIDFSKTDLSDPGKLTMREIIRRAEAIERKKTKVEGSKEAAQSGRKEKGDTVIEATPEVSMVPQVRVIDGQIVLNEESLTVGAHATTKQSTESYVRVEENASKLNYNSYLNRAPVERWKLEDTELFYKALEQFGTDFELILNLFPGRTRRQVKAKFKKEEKNNPTRLQAALAHRPKDQVHYTEMITRLKAEEPGFGVDDPFASMLADTNAAAAAAHVENAAATAAAEQTEKV